MIPVFDLSRQHNKLQPRFRAILQSVIKSNTYILGSAVSEFESAFARYIGVKYAVGVASGTDAITLTLLALGIGKGDEVIMPANTYPSVFGVLAAGATPKLVDIDPATYTIDPSRIEEKLTKHTKAILPIHLYGQPANMEPIVALGKKYGIPVVEDCAQAHGAEVKIQNSEFRIQKIGEQYTWRKAGSVGDVACFSYYPTKNLGALGDGGMVVTNDEEIYKQVKLLRMYGEDSRYHSVLVGRNSRLDELQAAFLLEKLKHLDTWNRRRRQIANMYSKLLSTKYVTPPTPSYDKRGIKGALKFPVEAEYAKHVYHLFVIRSSKRDELKVYLESKGIQTGIHYPVPIHRVPSLQYLQYREGDFPESERVSREVLSLPCFPELTDSEVETVIETLKATSL
jgi:dTDP-4-amino-4,6-dideoxygalactose transaminase